MNSKDSKSSTPIPPEAGRSGRVTHDARGNPVWEWQTSPGVFEKDVSTTRLKKLEAPGLSLMDTQTVMKQKTKEVDKNKGKTEAKAAEQLPGGAINPYDNGARQTMVREKPRQTFDASKHHPALAHKQQAVRKEPPRQSLQSKYRGKEEAKPVGLMDKIKSVFRGK